MQQLNEMKQQQVPDTEATAEIEEKITEMDVAKARGVQIRSRAKWIEQGDHRQSTFSHYRRKINQSTQSRN